MVCVINHFSVGHEVLSNIDRTYERPLVNSLFYCVIFFVERPNDKVKEIKAVAEQLSKLIEQGYVHLSTGQTGRYYLHYFDEKYDEPFRAIMLPTQYKQQSD